MNAGRLPLVSVVIPAHNAAETIGAQLAALAAQETVREHEVIVVLNRCTDNTADVCEEWAARLPRLRIIAANERAGPSYARNRGVDAADGEIVAFCDADDEVEPRWLEELVAGLETADLVGGRIVPHPSSDPAILEMFPVYRQQQRDGLSSHHTLLYSMTASLACRRSHFESIGGFDEEVRHIEDVLFCMRAQQAGLRMGFTPHAVCEYRLRTNLEEMARQRAGYSRGNVAFDARHHLAMLRPTSFEFGMLIALSAKSLIGPGATNRRRATVHRNVQRTRLQARRQVSDAELAAAPPGLATAVLAVAPKARRFQRLSDRSDRELNRLPPVEVTVRLEQPIIGGLGFVSPVREARAIAADRTPRADLLWTEENLRDDDTLIDLDPGCGTLLVGASKAAPGATIIGLDPDQSEVGACRTNMQRHLGNAGSVHILSSLDDVIVMIKSGLGRRIIARSDGSAATNDRLERIRLSLSGQLDLLTLPSNHRTLEAAESPGGWQIGGGPGDDFS